MTAYVFLGAFGWGEQASNEQAIGEISRWCERVSYGLFREPSNALSNLGFMFAGLMMLRILATDSDYLLDLNQFFGHTQYPFIRRECDLVRWWFAAHAWHPHLLGSLGR